MIVHIEVHSRDRQVEHYIVPNARNETDAALKMRYHFRDKGILLGLWDKESDRADPEITYFIFDIKTLEMDDVIYIAGEYRTQYPL